MLRLKILLAALSLVVVAGCGGPRVDVIDLNKVLSVMTATLDKMKKEHGNKTIDQNDPIAKQKFMKEFNTRFAKDLNAAKMISKPIGTRIEADGSVLGFTDTNKNMVRDYGDRPIFKIEIDIARNRLIATDLQYGYRRDSHFSGMSGLVTGMIIGSLLSRQRSFGITGSRFSNMRMSPRNYHSSAVSRAKSIARARARARSRSRSGSFSRGK